MNLNHVFGLAAILGLTGSAFATVTPLLPLGDHRILSYYGGNDHYTDFDSTWTEGGNNNLQRTLINFDYSSLPAGSKVTQAILRLFGNEYTPSSTSTTINFFRITANWAESAVTWNSKATGTLWTTKGGDFVGTTGVQNSNPYTSVTFNQPGSVITEYDFDVTSLVQANTVSGLPNYGFMMVGSEGNHMEFVNSIDPRQADRPVLLVTTVAVPEPSSLLALSVALGIRLSKRRRA